MPGSSSGAPFGSSASGTARSRPTGEALAHHPERSDLWSELAILYSEMGLFSESDQAVREAIRLKPNNAAAWHTIATNTLKQGKRDTAQRAYRRMKELNPDFADEILSWVAHTTGLPPDALSEPALAPVTGVQAVGAAGSCPSGPARSRQTPRGAVAERAKLLVGIVRSPRVASRVSPGPASRRPGFFTERSVSRPPAWRCSARAIPPAECPAALRLILSQPRGACCSGRLRPGWPLSHSGI